MMTFIHNIISRLRFPLLLMKKFSWCVQHERKQHCKVITPRFFPVKNKRTKPNPCENDPRTTRGIIKTGVKLPLSLDIHIYTG